MLCGTKNQASENLQDSKIVTNSRIVTHTQIVTPFLTSQKFHYHEVIQFLLITYKDPRISSILSSNRACFICIVSAFTPFNWVEFFNKTSRNWEKYFWSFRISSTSKSSKKFSSFRIISQFGWLIKIWMRNFFFANLVFLVLIKNFSQNQPILLRMQKKSIQKITSVNHKLRYF